MSTKSPKEQPQQPDQPIEEAVVPVPVRRTTIRPSIDPRLTSLAKQVVDGHRGVQKALATSLQFALQSGRALRAMQGYVGHGEWTNFVDEYFCRRHGISLRTAQRYIKLASSYPQLIEALKATKTLEEMSATSDEESLLEGVPINRALTLIRSAVNAQEGAQESNKLASQPVGPNEWWTPEEIVKKTVTVLGSIDLDPCACGETDPIPAIRRIVLPNDGLSEELSWQGNVLINPGLRTSQAGWIQKALDSWQSNQLKSAILILPAATNADWAQKTRRFPRAFFTSPLTVTGPGRTTPLRISAPAMVVFIGPQDKFKLFAEQFHDALDVFLPF